MKKQRLSLLSTLGAVIISACSVFGTGCAQNGIGADKKLSQAPDYSAYSELKFESFGYSGLHNGIWSLDGEYFDVGEDFRSYERFVEYKEAGFTVYLAGLDTRIEEDFNEEYWEEYKLMMDEAHRAGLKVILRDQRLLNRSMYKDKGLIGEDNDQFQDETALDAYVADCVKYYKDHPAFYGVIIGDEPVYSQVTAYGQMYKAIKRVLPNKHVQFNLLPPGPLVSQQRMDELFPKVEREFTTLEEELLARWEKYLSEFIDAMGTDYVQYDDYPIRKDKKILPLYVASLQIASNLAKEKGVKLHFVSQTFALNNGDYDKVSEEHAVWMNNMMLGHGIKEMQYFTYMPSRNSRTDGEWFMDGASYLTNVGEKTSLYYFMKKIMQENNKFAPTILNFDYQGSRSYVKLPVNFTNDFITHVDNSYAFKKIVDLKIDKETSYVSELYDSENELYMYMLMNATAPWNKGSKAYQTTDVTFSDEYTHVVVYKNGGEGTPQKLDNHKYTVSLTSGEAIYLLPY